MFMETKTFREQAEKYMLDIASDVRPATLHVYRSMLDAQLLPALGEEALEGIGNKTAKMLVQRLTSAGKSPATIRLAVCLMKQVLASATNDEGDALFPRQWNAKFIKAPKVSDQKAPVCALEGTQKALMCSEGHIRALVALLGGSGLRIGEALAVTVQNGPGNVWDARTATITVGATQTPSGLQNEPKTDAGKRVIDLHANLNRLLTELGRAPGERLFPISYRTALRKLKGLGVPGCHSMRRMRLTYLDSQNVPRSTVEYWAGHAAANVTERYLKGGAEIAQRKDWTERAGLGFQL
jgi:integrase